MQSKTLCNVFYAIKPSRTGNQNQYHEKALCWLKSTYSNREETEDAWIRLKQPHWPLQYILEVTKLGLVLSDSIQNT
jgi:hypothetical protein